MQWAINRHVRRKPKLYFAVGTRITSRLRASGHRTVQRFMLEALPTASEATRALAGVLTTAALSQVEKHFLESARPPAEIEAYADALPDVLCAYPGPLSQRDL